MRRHAALHLLVLALVLGLTTLHSAGPARADTEAAEAANLVAPAYPDSLLVTSPEEQEYLDYFTYYSKAPEAQVVTFYEDKLGRKIEDGSVGTGLSGRSFIRGKVVEASVSIKNLKNQSSAGKVFERLKEITKQGRHSKAEYQQVYAQYGHLAKSYFLPTLDGNRDAVIYSEYEDKLDQAKAGLEGGFEDTGARMQELMQQGRFEEMAELSEQMLSKSEGAAEQAEAGSVAGVDIWDNWIQCLKEMDRHAYPTMIKIDKHPSQWN